ncbi:hypothetical protein DVA67_015605 [Solirubrobacter sp. CPCC 204708]|uniref:Uncharacterized protein n=1 Tax=Solirubrobacter deserti TaxID=2282478 RepID=A0ABT4RNX4_9ACTN|nr:hypothetical protein [Solirubrobacter deserti]MBE2317408.1 hypothetical protein [Solirubrobacter deserti]MDA0139990.1 hypothetical protein [Solirubrobacter deserti]
MRRPAAVLAALCVLVALALVAVGLTQRSSLAFTLGVAPAVPAAEIAAGQTVCQTAIAVPERFDRVAVWLKPSGGGGPALEALVRDRTSGLPVIARGTLPAGYREGERAIPVDAVPAGRDVDVCLRNRGTGRVQLVGNADAASRPTTAYVEGNPTLTDITLVFERSPRSLLAQAGAIADRASLFKLSWIGGWALWVVAALVLLAVPALLVRALRGVQ